MVNDTIHRLRAALNMSGFTKKALAKQCSLHANTLLGCEGDAWNPTLATLRALDAWLPTWVQIENGVLPTWAQKEAFVHPATDTPDSESDQSGKSEGVTAPTYHAVSDGAFNSPPSVTEAGGASSLAREGDAA